MSYWTIAASAALLLSVVALAVALTASGSDERSAAPGIVDRVRAADRADSAEQADRAARADVAERATSAGQARRAGSAQRLSGIEGRRLADASRRAGGVRRPRLVGVSADATETAFRSGPFRITLACQGTPKGTELQISFASRHDGSMASFDASKGVSIDADGRVVLQLVSDEAAWVGGRSFSLASPRGSVVEGVLSFGINTLGDDCVASAAGLS